MLPYGRCKPCRIVDMFSGKIVGKSRQMVIPDMVIPQCSVRAGLLGLSADAPSEGHAGKQYYFNAHTPYGH